ncbi:MAG: M43 family zinc metalloprotease [Bacteroidetes bacterium]|nr:M43 family zinc metalloprotease [Bacteroidota bacterium]
MNLFQLKRALLPVFFLVIFSAQLHAQENHFCFTSEIYHQRLLEHPEIMRMRNALEEHTGRMQAKVASGNHVSGQVYIIPILHNYGTENISDAQVLDQVRILNDDYRLRSYDTAAIAPAFKPVAADCEIEFRLATIDPNGNCTTGIDRIPSLLTYNAGDNSKLNPWPDNQYLNVWVVSSLGWSGVAAYAYYPGTAPPGADGVIILANYVGSIGLGNQSNSRVLTHEIGHCLNLEHVWGDTNNPGVACGDDLVSDTPITLGWTICNVNGATCGNVIDNVQNYMEYSFCCKMFTQGQKTRMRAALTSPVGGRNNLSTPANLVATGTDGTPAQLCAPVADFKSDIKICCAGSSVQFTDLSSLGHPTSWNWSFPGGSPASSVDSMPIVQYNSPGLYNASLTSGNASGSSSKTKNTFLRVNGGPTQIIPFMEGFETSGSFPGADGYVLNPDSGNTWQRVTNAGSTGTASIKINNYSGNANGELDDYVTPSFDLSTSISLTLDFQLAYAQRDTAIKDQLNVMVSTNCGKTWTQRYSKYGAGLATASARTSSFTPGASDWRQEHVNIGPYHNMPNVRFKFQNKSARGNNIYIDDININGIVAGIDETDAAASSFLVFPNPAQGNFSVTFELEKNTKVNIEIADALGRKVKTLAGSEFPAGHHRIAVDKKMDAGIYFIQLEKGGEIFTKKLVITKD